MDKILLLEEGKKLEALFEKLKREKNISRKKFAEMNKIPGKDAMIYQHIKGIRPINLEHAAIYAIGLDCKLEDISPRLAEEAKTSAFLILNTELAGNPVNELTPRQQALLGLFEGLTDRQKDDLIRELQEKKQQNDELLTELLKRKAR